MIITTAIRKINALKRRIKIIQGGTSAGKTYGILPILITKAATYPRTEISIVAESIPHLRRGALKDFLKIMKETNRYFDERFNKTLLRYEFANGSFIEFFSADDSSKLRGARRDILYINECNNVTFESYNELAIRTKKEIYLDFNPANEFWVHKELKGESDADFLILTYKDNEALDKSIIDQLEKNRLKAETSSYWANWCRVYLDGEIGMLEGVIFSNWKSIDKLPTEAKLIGIGLDFGYTNDPTAAIEIYNYNGTRILNELVYRTGMLNSDIAKILPKNVVVYADSSEPKSIDEIKRYGITIKGVTKGKDSINYGIDVMQQQEYLVTSNSVNLIKELRAYCWDVDKQGTRLNKPIDTNNHCFIGSTLITTINGDVPIKKIQIGDLVLTSKGYKKVLKTFNNGVKQVNKYSMLLDTNVVYLCSTKEHKIKTTKEWMQISELKKNNVLYQYKSLMEKNTDYIKVKDILAVVIKDFMLRCGSITKEKYQRAIMFIMLMAIRTTIIYPTLISFALNCIFVTRVKNALKKILNGQKNFMQKALRKQKNGINQMQEKNGIKNTEKNVGLINQCLKRIVKYVIKNTKHHSLQEANFVIQTAKLQRLDVGESWSEMVYDIMVEDCHEYFANGILVHNCVDALRYHEMETLGLKRNYGTYNIR